MSSSNLAKKLLPTWKSFTKALKSKLENLNISKFLMEKTRFCLTSLQSFPVKLCALCTRLRLHHQHQDLQMNIDAIYVDQLFEGKNKAKEMGATSGSSAENYKAKAEKVTSFPQWQGIDERAEEFISKFRENMKLQREQSLLDFQEMLARSA